MNEFVLFCVGGKLLDKVASEVKSKVADEVQGKEVTLIQDGWSDVHNQPVIASTIHTGSKSYFLFSCDTGAHSKTSEYCAGVAFQAIEEAKELYNVKVTGLVTDNEAKIVKMREIVNRKHGHITVYGCSSHYLNLFGSEITVTAIINQVVEVSKYFRNHHVPNSLLAAYKDSVKPVLPGATRWNSQVDCLKSYVRNRPFLMSICSDTDSIDVDSRICRIVNNIGLFQEAKN